MYVSNALTRRRDFGGELALKAHPSVIREEAIQTDSVDQWIFLGDVTFEVRFDHDEANTRRRR
jgi:hypothetical protein